jgi:hypothetical protein
MYFSPFLLSTLLVFLLVWGNAAAREPFVRVELVPDEATAQVVCTNEFKQSLASQFSSWVSQSTLDQFSALKLIANTGPMSLEMTYDRDEHARKRSLRKVQPATSRSLSSSCGTCTSGSEHCFTYCGVCGALCGGNDENVGNVTTSATMVKRAQTKASKVQTRQLTCSCIGCCTSCCNPYPLCSGKCGTCTLCPAASSANSLAVTAAKNGTNRALLSTTKVTTPPTNFFEDSISKRTLHLARQWVAVHDKTQCMGDPSKLLAYVTFGGMGHDEL